MPREKLINSEKDVKKKIISPWLKKLGAWEFMPVQTGMGKSGVPDHLACVPITITKDMVGMKVGLFVSPEAKRPGKKLNSSDRQKDQMQEIDEAGGITGVISCEWDMKHMWLRIINLQRGK